MELLQFIQAMIDAGFFVELTAFNKDFITLEIEKGTYRKSYRGVPELVLVDAKTDNLYMQLFGKA